MPFSSPDSKLSNPSPSSTSTLRQNRPLSHVAPSDPSHSPVRSTLTLPSTVNSPTASASSTPLLTPRSLNPNNRNPRARSRTSTLTFTPPLAPVMSRENSLEMTDDMRAEFLGAASLPSSSSSAQPLPPTTSGRKASKSVSNARPPLAVGSMGQRTKSYHAPSSSAGPSTAPIPTLLSSPTDTMNPRLGLKRRISTPSMFRQDGEDDNANVNVNVKDVDAEVEQQNQQQRRKAAVETRARSTSTSVAPLPGLISANAVAGPSQDRARPSPPYGANLGIPTPPTDWAPIFVTPASPDDLPPHPAVFDPDPIVTPRSQRARRSERGTGLLSTAYDIGESSVLRLSRWIRPSKTRHPLRRRGSDEDSEKGLTESEEDTSVQSPSNATSRTSEDSLRRNGKYWGIWGTSEDEDVRNGAATSDGEGYFSMPSTPPEEKPAASLAEFEAALNRPATLPTPALSTRSLSKPNKSRRSPQMGDAPGEEREGWLATVCSLWANVGTSRRSGGKTAEVIRELGWTVAMLVGLFVVTAATVLWMIQALPITQLKRLPTSTTDLQLLSAEIRSYMASSDVGWWHTVGVLTFVGCWKHAWSVPGAVVLNILVGSLLEPLPALFLLTLITATGSLFSYLLSRPLAPLIAVLFPKPLALVRAALAPEQVPQPPATSYEMTEKVSPIQVTPGTAPIGGESNNSVWRRLLIMRAMGFVPWSGMNVACGVVNVDWKIFWLTTAAGSASWSYVTASVGNILSRLAIPPGALDNGLAGEELIDGESLTSLLRDPVLITKLVFLSGLTLLPVVLKRRNRPVEDSPVEPVYSGGISPDSPTSPLTRSLARFTPTPAAFDLLSFGRTAVRQGGNVVLGAVRGTVGGVRRLSGM